MEHYNSFVEMDGYTIFKIGFYLGSVALAALWAGKNDSPDTKSSQK